MNAVRNHVYKQEHSIKWHSTCSTVAKAFFCIFKTQVWWRWMMWVDNMSLLASFFFSRDSATMKQIILDAQHCLFLKRRVHLAYMMWNTTNLYVLCPFCPAGCVWCCREIPAVWSASAGPGREGVRLRQLQRLGSQRSFLTGEGHMFVYPSPPWKKNFFFSYIELELLVFIVWFF